MSNETAVVKPNLRKTLTAHAEKLAVFGVSPEAYIEAALMATVKVPELLNCTPESIMLALRQCAQTGLEIGRTAHLLPYGSTCTFVPDYKGLIELAMGTHKVVSIRTRCVYQNEVFHYSEDMMGPDLKHTPILSGDRGPMVGAYAIADLRHNRFKVEWMSVEEIDRIRQDKSKSWKRGELPDWYARKTVVRKLCKTLPSSAKLQQALKYDDTEEIADAEISDVPAFPSRTRALQAPPQGDEYGVPQAGGSTLTVTDGDAVVNDPHYAESARRGASKEDPYTGSAAA